MDILEVKAFNTELSGLYENKPPISKAKMSAITRGAIKAIKFYKHVVHSVEKFIQKCKPEYKIPGLYVIDSIVRQSRHQFGADKDVFAPRFSKNLQQTFINLLRCPPEDKRNIIRVLNLWQKNAVFSADVIQPLFDMINPNHPIHQEILAQGNNANGSLNSSLHVDPRTTPGPPHGSQHTPNDDQGKTESIYSQLRQALRDTNQSNTQPGDKHSSGNFNRRLLNVDFEYESDDEGTGEKTANINVTATTVNLSDASSQQTGGMVPALSQPPPPPLPSQAPLSYLPPPSTTDQLTNLNSILANPEILRHLQNLQAAQMMVANFPQLQGMNSLGMQQEYFDMTQPPPGFVGKEEPQASSNTTAVANNAVTTKPKSPLMDEVNNESDIEFVDAGPQVIEIDGNDSRSPSPRSARRRRSRSRDRSRRSRSRSRSRRFSRSRSRDRRSRRSRDRDRERDRDRTGKERGRDRERDKERDKEKEKEREKERERKKKGLPPVKKMTLSVCSTTLWVGHLSKLVQAEDLSDAFGPIGEVLSIDLVPPRGCAFIVMNRRRDAYRALIKLDKQKIHNKSITVAWAPGKGVKGREWKDYWEAEAGACYVPWDKLPPPGAHNATQLLDSLEEGGMLDDETLPPWLQRKGSEVKAVLPAEVAALTHPLLAAANTAASMMVVPPLQPNTTQKLGVDAGRLPTSLAPLAFPPHPGIPLPLLPLQAFKPQPQPGLQQALHLQAMLAHQQQQQQQLAAAQLLLGPPPRLPQPTPVPTVQQPLSSVTSETQKDEPMEIDNADDTPAPEVTSKDSASYSTGDGSNVMSDKFKNLVSQPPPGFNIPPPLLGQMPPTHLMPPNARIPPMPPGLNTSQPPPSFDKQQQNNQANNNMNSNSSNNNNSSSNNWDDKDRDNRDRRDRDGRRGDRDRRDRDGGRRDSRHDRDRDGHRDRDTDRDRDRNRDRDRDRGGRDKGSRWRDGSRERGDMVGGDRPWDGPNSNSGGGMRGRGDQTPPQHRSRERSRPKDGPPSEGLLGEAPMPLSRAMSPGAAGPPVMARALPHMAPFRIGARDDIRMRGMGPRGPMGPGMRPGVWMDGPNPQFGPRFGGGPPPFNRPPFDGPPFEGPPFRDGMDGPPYGNGIKSRFDRPFDREYDRNFDRDYDRQPYDGRPSFDGMGRPPFERPAFDEPFDDRPPFDGPPRFNRSPFDDQDRMGPAPRAQPPPPRAVRSEREGRKRDGERVSRWASRESPEKQPPPAVEEQAEQTNKASDEKPSSLPVTSEPSLSVQSEKPKEICDTPKEIVEKECTATKDENKMSHAESNVVGSYVNVPPTAESSEKIVKPVDDRPRPMEVERNDKPMEEERNAKPMDEERNAKPMEEERNPKPMEEEINAKPMEEERNPKPMEEERNVKPMEIERNEVVEKPFVPPPAAVDMFSEEIQPVVSAPPKEKPAEPVVESFKPVESAVVKPSVDIFSDSVKETPAIVATPEISIAKETPAQRKFYEPTISEIRTAPQKDSVVEQEKKEDDRHKFIDSESQSPPQEYSEPVAQNFSNRLYSPEREEPSKQIVPEIIERIEHRETEKAPQQIEKIVESVREIDGDRQTQEDRSTPCRDEPAATSITEGTEETNP